MAAAPEWCSRAIKLMHFQTSVALLDEAMNGLTGSRKNSDWGPPSAPVADLGSINPPTIVGILPFTRILTPLATQ